MCGIHGFVTGKKRNVNADDFVANAFVAGSLRGTDSAGIASVDLSKKEIDYQKLPMAGPMFVTERYAGQLIRAAANVSTITICHTRAATSGNIGINEAHPFIVDNAAGRELVGVHNGTLTGWHTKPHGRNYKVDSEWALTHIFNEGIDAFEDFTGAFCFVWWDSADEGVLNIALNNDRPMYVAFTEDDGMAYASEAGMLYWLCERNRIKLVGPVLQLTGKHWYKFDVDKLSGYSKLKIPEPKVATYPYSGGTNTAYPTYTAHKSAMVKMRELLDGIGTKPAAESATTGSHLSLVPASPIPTPSVTMNEQQNARDLLMMGERGEFIPTWYDEASGELQGMFQQMPGGQLDAIIRNAQLIDFGPDTMFSTSVIGVLDDGRDMVCICDKPFVQVRQASAVH